MEQFPEMLTTREVAFLFRVSRNTILRWVARGYLEAIRPMDGKYLYPSGQRAILNQRRLMNNV
jgi:excisionase family DNA binding protein